MNPLFNQYGNQSNGSLGQFMSQLEQFKKTFSGNPRDEVQKMLNSGRLSQSQFNHYAQIANQLYKMLPK